MISLIKCYSNWRIAVTASWWTIRLLQLHLSLFPFLLQVQCHLCSIQFSSSQQFSTLTQPHACLSCHRENLPREWPATHKVCSLVSMHSLASHIPLAKTTESHDSHIINFLSWLLSFDPFSWLSSAPSLWWFIIPSAKPWVSNHIKWLAWFTRGQVWEDSQSSHPAANLGLCSSSGLERCRPWMTVVGEEKTSLMNFLSGGVTDRSQIQYSYLYLHTSQFPNST